MAIESLADAATAFLVFANAHSVFGKSVINEKKNPCMCKGSGMRYYSAAFSAAITIGVEYE